MSTLPYDIIKLIKLTYNELFVKINNFDSYVIYKNGIIKRTYKNGNTKMQ